MNTCTTEKETQKQFTMHDFDIFFPISKLISSGVSQLIASEVSQLTGNEASQFSVSGVEDGEPNAGVDYPLATEI